MAELVGYRLLDQNGTVVGSWGGVFGQCPGVPNSIRLPSDPPADVQCPVVGVTYEQWALQPWMMDAPTPDGAAVDTERDRRRCLPLIVTTSPTGTFQIQMDNLSQQNIAGLATAGVVLSSSAPSQTTAFRDLANLTHNLLPSELVAMGLQVMAHIGALYAKSWALKAMSPVPSDYTADSYWS